MNSNLQEQNPVLTFDSKVPLPNEKNTFEIVRIQFAVIEPVLSAEHDQNIVHRRRSSFRKFVVEDKLLIRNRLRVCFSLFQA